MEHPERPAEAVARDVIAHLQQSVQALMDGDRVLPADGSSLQMLLERALQGLTAEDAPAARAGIEAFIDRAQALIAAGVLEAADGRPRIAAAAALGALLPSAGGTDLKPRRRHGDPSGDNVARPQTDRTTGTGAERRPPLAERQTER
jgi:hypothetical protein